MRRTTVGFICLGAALLATPAAAGAETLRSAPGRRARLRRAAGRRGHRQHGVDVARPRASSPRSFAAGRAATGSSRRSDSGEPVGASTAIGSNERIDLYAERGQRFVIQACRTDGGPEGGPPRHLLRPVPPRAGRAGLARPRADRRARGRRRAHEAWASTSRTRSVPTRRRSSFTRARSACDCRNADSASRPWCPTSRPPTPADRRTEARVAARGTARSFQAGGPSTASTSTTRTNSTTSRPPTPRSPAR